MSAQLTRHPSLEDYYGYLPALNARFSDPAFANSPDHGLPLPGRRARCRERYESRFGAGAANSNRYLYLIGLPHPEAKGSKAAHDHHEEAGIPPRHLPAGSSGTGVYGGSLFASSMEGPVRLMVSFRRRNDPDTILTSAYVQVPDGGKWTKLPFRLESTSRGREVA